MLNDNNLKIVSHFIVWSIDCIVACEVVVIVVSRCVVVDFRMVSHHRGTKSTVSQAREIHKSTRTEFIA